MVERCKEAQEHMEPECEDMSLLALLRSQGLRNRPDEAPSTDSLYTLPSEREERPVRPLDNDSWIDLDCSGV